jgi:1-acyl-sn-glycerol-3-phosphate acyltransferase|tara:strand:+ start:15284 stop:15898 length:615 start_codon:yes stop_codon:yes gene_type:complete
MQTDQLSEHDGPRYSYPIHLFGRLFAKITRWRVTGRVPDNGKMVIIAAPHTTNWDFVYLMMAAFVFRLKIHWMGKRTLFKPPFGTFMRLLGGIAVDRNQSGNLVDQLTQEFQQQERLAVAIPPSGTRRKTDYWRSGFYWIAHQAQVPIVCGYLDYQQREAGLGLSFVPTGDVRADMEKLRDFYREKVAKYPHRSSRIRLREEDR